MSYISWALLNPTQMEEYKALVKQLDDVRNAIANYSQMLKDARNGIEPDHQRRGNLYAPLYDMPSILDLMPLTYYVVEGASPQEIEEAEERARQSREDIKIESFKESHQAKLKATISSCEFELYGHNKDYTAKTEGLYARRNRLCKLLREFDPLEHIMSYQHTTETGGEFSDLKKMLIQRLCPIHWYFDGVYVLIDSEWLAGAYHYLSQIEPSLQILVRHESPEIACVCVSDERISFTRRSDKFRMDYMIMRAIFSYVEARWDHLHDISLKNNLYQVPEDDEPENI